MSDTGTGSEDASAGGSAIGGGSAKSREFRSKLAAGDKRAAVIANHNSPFFIVKADAGRAVIDLVACSCGKL